LEKSVRERGNYAGKKEKVLRGVLEEVRGGNGNR